MGVGEGWLEGGEVGGWVVVRVGRRVGGWVQGWVGGLTSQLPHHGAGSVEGASSMWGARYR